jgi:hypothetical protein
MEDIDKARKVVENFILEMNHWEKDSEKIDNNKNDGLTWEQKDAIIKEKVVVIINKYCTPKKRAMSAPNSIMRGLEGTYKYDPNEEKIEDIKIERPNRIAVYTNKKDDGENYLYILLRKDDKWLIDSKKRKYFGDKEWKNSYI